eukprot:TRINITY_DN12384_c0_g1_i3.p1 TRINITY_DN12384_c0_g1~~TRINITY_DN12384_c0_g1_i3.p1  ORF type:complete len:314 (-),score=52.40 TRINITY_DN12384_c0_g1_i3:277-1116(-)
MISLQRSFRSGVCGFDGSRSAQRCRTGCKAATEMPKMISPTPDTVHAWQSADLVCFDVDSTFCTDESIDEIAAFMGKGEAVAELTREAMGGSMKFQDALKLRLDVINASQDDIEAFKKAKPPSLSPGIPELVAALQRKGTAVALVSGGFRQIIEPMAADLHIPVSHVHANRLLFNEDGSAAGFDAEEFTSRSGGKAEACTFLREKFGYKKVVMVGDGATDAEAKQCGAADIFIYYGGVVHRENVAAQADWVVMRISELLAALTAFDEQRGQVRCSFPHD